MKKTISSVLVFLMLASLAFAANGQKPNIGDRDNLDPDGKLVSIRSEIQGLENAALRVRTMEQQRHLEQVMEKIQTQARERLRSMSYLEIEEDEDGEITATGRRLAKFRLFNLNLNHKYKYTINEETGELVRKKGLLDFMWKDLEE